MKYQSMGETVYGIKDNPIICHICFENWRKFFDKNRDCSGVNFSANWQQLFEEWIKYGKELLVFS